MACYNFHNIFFLSFSLFFLTVLFRWLSFIISNANKRKFHVLVLSLATPSIYIRLRSFFSFNSFFRYTLNDCLCFLECLFVESLLLLLLSFLWLIFFYTLIDWFGLLPFFLSFYTWFIFLSFCICFFAFLHYVYCLFFFLLTSG